MGRFEDLTVDGGTARAYVAGEDGRRGILLLHAWWGLNEDVHHFANRLAGAGYAVVAPDSFGGEVATSVERAEKLATGADPGRVEAIALAAVDRLAALTGPDVPLAVVGFSFGAAFAFAVPASRPAVRATVVYYGTNGGPILSATTVPVLGHFAEDDPYEPADWVEEVERTLREAGRDVEFHRYPGTGHWFAEPSKDAYDPAAAELAWERTLAFLAERLGRG